MSKRKKETYKSWIGSAFVILGIAGIANSHLLEKNFNLNVNVFGVLSCLLILIGYVINKRDRQNCAKEK